MPSGTANPWPELPVEAWSDTRDTLQLWTQIVGKVRMATTPVINHWWNVPLYVSARGLTTGLVPHGDRGFQIDFDLIGHRLEIAATDGRTRSTALVSRSVAEFHAEVMAMLGALDLGVEIWTMPVEIEGAVPFERDDLHATYDPEMARRFWLALVQIDRVLHVFRARFLGKASPVHLFWGALDLAVTRFSGRTAPPYPGQAPHCGPQVMEEAYSHEVSSAGYWPGPDGEGNFYSYAYPEPDGFRTAAVAPAGATFDEALGEFVLPYTLVRTATHPDEVLLEFLQSTYEAAARSGDWDRPALERP